MNSLKLECSNCEEPLIELSVSDNVKLNFSVVATCPFCGDKSFQQEVTGLFSYIPAKSKKTGKPNTIIKDVVTDSGSDVVTIITEKFNG